jgi:hypothetical protein
MRFVVTGSDEKGRSFVVREESVDLGDRAMIWESTADQRVSFPIGSEGRMDFGVAPGCTRWFTRSFEPNNESPMHWTPTIDFDCVVSGEIDLVLDEGTVKLHSGDGVVVSGIRHQWRTGDAACQMLIVMNGKDAGSAND